MNRTLRSLGALLTVAATASGCGTMTVNPIVQYLDDTSTTTAIKARLATDAGMGSLTGVGVTTRDDVVRLTGTVADNAQRQYVETIARHIAGDNRVISELQVASSVSASPTTETALEPAAPPAAKPAPAPVIQPAVKKAPAQRK
jgi:hypothetical protein